MQLFYKKYLVPLFSPPFFSFSQDSVKTVTIEHDSIYNPRFNAIANLLFDHLRVGDLKVYQNDLDTIANMNYINERITGEASTIDDQGNEIILLTHYDETNVNDYEVARKNNKWFICPHTGSASCIWIGLDDLKGILPDSSVAYLKDIFINEHTYVACKIKVAGDVNADFDNSMRSVFFKIRSYLMQGEVKAYDDIDFLIERSMSRVNSSLYASDTIQTENFEVNDGWEVRSREVLPTYFDYLFNGEWSNGKLKLDRSDIKGIAPMAPCYFNDGFGGGDCQRTLFWLRYSELKPLLLNYEKEIIMANLNKQYNDYIVDRYSESDFSIRHQADSSKVSALMIKLVRDILQGNLSAFRDIECKEQMPISEIDQRMHDSSSISYPGKFPQQIEKIVLLYDWLGLSKYHYRTDDHHFSTASFPYAISLGYMNDGRVHHSLLIYLPELRGRISEEEYNLFMHFFETNIFYSGEELSIDSDGSVLIDNRRAVYSNLPSPLVSTGKKIWIEYETLFKPERKELGEEVVYINTIVEDEKETNPLKPDAYYIQHPLIPYNSRFGKNENFSQYPMVLIPYKAGYCDEDGIIRIKLKYDYTEFFSEGRGLVGNRVNENGKFLMRFGFVDVRGNEVIPPLEYEDALSFSNGLAAVKMNGKWGYITKNALTGLPFEFDRAYSFSDERAVVVKDKKFYIINLKGKIQGDILCDTICTFHDGLARISYLGQYGFINKKGKLVVPALFKQADDIENGIVKCTDMAEKKHFFDHKGKELFVGIEHVETASGKIGVKKADDKFMMIDLKGKELKKLDYAQITQFSEGLMAVRKGYCWVFIDLLGNEVISNVNGKQIGWTSSFTDSVCLVSFSGTNTVCVIDRKGKLITSFPNVQVQPYLQFEKGYLRVNNRGIGYINKSGKEYFYH